jgi:hypothetical protein
MLQFLYASRKYHWALISAVDMKVFASDKFIRIDYITIAHICLLEVFPAEAENFVCALTPWNDVCRS